MVEWEHLFWTILHIAVRFPVHRQLLHPEIQDFCCVLFQRGSNFDEEREDPNTTISGAIIGPPAKHHLNGVSLACNIECWHGGFVICQGIRRSIAKIPYIFVIFQTPNSSLRIRACIPCREIFASSNTSDTLLHTLQYDIYILIFGWFICYFCPWTLCLSNKECTLILDSFLGIPSGSTLFVKVAGYWYPEEWKQKTLDSSLCWFGFLLLNLAQSHMTLVLGGCDAWLNDFQ